ncbi:hypothetical protein [Actinomadura flavalba]|uniref:hypothetical protein n=1 Tax=Actinomadura flavalba TaxID=1120938 RepID=UPI00036C269A|nr:hypothetical protein [Actinomadura flavalba]
MITGVDTVLVAAAPVEGAVRGFVGAVAERWPALRVAVEEGESGVGPFVPFDRLGVLPAASGNVLVARDAEMVRRWDEDGYEPDAGGEGPFMVMYEPCRAPAVRVHVLDDPYARPFGFAAHDAVLVGARLSLVTLVAPDRDGGFSRWLVAELTRRLGATG